MIVIKIIVLIEDMINRPINYTLNQVGKVRMVLGSSHALLHKRLDEAEDAIKAFEAKFNYKQGELT